jgi:hypothetical protein
MTTNMTTTLNNEGPFYSKHHLTMLFKYSGISFISGAVNHGFFSGERSLYTALFGIVIFVAAVIFENRAEKNTSEQSNIHLLKSVVLGAILSIGIGFFTGGLQHFPDSPLRSGWVVPLGFVISLLGLAWTLQLRFTKTIMLYAIISTTIVSGVSWAAADWLINRNPPTTNTHLPASTQAYQHANDAMHANMNIAFTGNADADFLAAMIPHHQGAIDMANVVLMHGKDPKIKALAQTIITAQEREIKEMNQLRSLNPTLVTPPAVKKPPTGHDHSSHAH